uniref:F-box domain-containing protein n=1 Tax=Setaria italica TaxID=4555 RepID=K3ZM59_SETIT
MASGRQCRLLIDLPMEVLINIAGHVAATSLQPMDDLHNLRVVYRVMHRACGDPSVGRRVALLRTYWEDMQWNELDRYYILLALLVGVGNPEACTIKGILSHVAAGGHDVGAYLYTLMMYRNNGGGADDDIVKMYI